MILPDHPATSLPNCAATSLHDPIFAAITAHKAAMKAFDVINIELDEAECLAAKTYGTRPEDDNEGLKWYARAGLIDLRAQYDLAFAAEHKADWRFARTKPTTTAGAIAMITYIRRDCEAMESIQDWQITALKTVASALRTTK